MTNEPADDEIRRLMEGFAPDDEVVVLTDLAAGSVNQKFFAYRGRPHTHIVSGMNLPLALAVALEPSDDYLSSERMAQIVEEAKNEVKYVSALIEEDDEDE